VKTCVIPAMVWASMNDPPVTRQLEDTEALCKRMWADCNEHSLTDEFTSMLGSYLILKYGPTLSDDDMANMRSDLARIGWKVERD
jgi:hypothetical protein